MTLEQNWFLVSRSGKHGRRYPSVHRRSASWSIRVTLIKSIAPNKDRREVIRKTWGAASNFEGYPAKIVFLLGIEEHPRHNAKVWIQ